MSGYFARLAQRSGVGATAAARPAPDAAAAPVMPLEQSIEIAALPSERPAAARPATEARTAAPRLARRAAIEGGAEIEQSEATQRPLGPKPAGPVARLPAEPAPPPEAWLAPATAAQDASASRLVDDEPKAAIHPAPPVEPAAPGAPRIAALTATTIVAADPLDAEPPAPAARRLLTSPRETIDPTPPAASGPVEVRIGTITLRVQPPPAAPPARPAAPPRAERFSPHRHYLRAW